MIFYIIPLVFTIIIEMLALYLLGFRNRNLYLGLLLVNILTNPLLNFIVMEFSINYIGVIICEIIVVIIEGLLLKLIVRDNLPYFRLSFIMNSVSFLIGLWLPWRLIWNIFL